MGLQRVGTMGGTPGVRQVRPEQDKVAVLVGGDAVPDIALAPAVQCQRQLELRMVVPEEGNAAVEPAMEHAPRRPLGNGHLLEERAHF
jgi:hypothetical protein